VAGFNPHFLQLTFPGAHFALQVAVIGDFDLQKKGIIVTPRRGMAAQNYGFNPFYGSQWIAHENIRKLSGYFSASDEFPGPLSAFNQLFVFGQHEKTISF
jgi:hypothetical protein